jgi:hypothetical protein
MMTNFAFIKRKEPDLPAPSLRSTSNTAKKREHENKKDK